MLMYGNASNIIPTGNVYNITSLREGLPKLSWLIPPNAIGKLSGIDFDIAYMNYIFSNDVIFKEFFDIIYSIYIGTDVYLVISDTDDWAENLIESLIKLIQQRYNVIAYKINCFDDYVYFANSSNKHQDFSEFGIYNFDQDRDRYTMFIESVRIANGGKIYYDDE